MIQRIRRKFVLLIAGIVLLVPQVQASLKGRVNAVIGQKQFRNVQFGVHIVDAASGRVLYARNYREAMTPASNMKILASAAALRFLGADYKFTTEVGLIGNTLVVIGAGDPLIGDEDTDKKYGRKVGWFIDAIAAELKDRDVKSLDEIIIDSTFFDDERVNNDWPKDQLNRAYACEVSGVNYNRNCVKLKVFRDGSRVGYSVSPATGYLTITNRVKAVSSGNSAAGAYRNHKPNVLTLKGRCRKATTFDVAIEGPAMFFGTLLKERLASAGIKVKGGVDERYVKNRSGMRTIMKHQTPLTDVLRRCNKNSLNLAAEALVKTLSAEKTTGRLKGQWKHGLSLAGIYMTRLGIDADEFNLVDGSGLSKNNKLSPRAITTVLMDIYAGSNWQTYKDSFAIGGVDGTAKKYFSEAKYKGKIFAKTGYIKGVRAYSGYIETTSGNYIFSILTKGGSSAVRGAINNIVKAVIDEAS
ncbi:MAG: D-alanyl-D-alanine carboxypeptidase/D-alanyl-D-alanine-endopeptidase [Planctomycetes bacterium]|nr:D-alanyl-D-alanine carboxypeptidase/D-alanyl-D-alanine-endopeptidase [Planctomycetota bacterium]